MESFAPAPAPRHGVLFMIGSALGFSLMTLGVKLLGGRIPVFQIVFVRGVLTAALTALMLRRAGVPPWGHRRRALLARAGLGVIALVFFFAAATRLPLAEVTIVHYTSPLFTAVIAALWLREGLGRALVAGLVTGFAGIVVLSWPALRNANDGTGHLPWIGAALASALLAALAYTTVRDLRRTEHPLVIVFWFALVMMPASIVPALAGWVAPSPRDWALLGLVAGAAQLGQVFLTWGLWALPAGRAMAVGYVQVGFAALWGILFFGDTLHSRTILGVTLVVLGALAANAGRPGAQVHPERTRAVQ